LVRFKCRNNEYGQVEYYDIGINSEQKHLLPPSFNEGNIDGWIRSRVIPKNREFVQDILRYMGNPGSAIDLIYLSLGLSVNDSYWVVPEGFEGKFKDFNLYENKFNRTLELVAFTGNGDGANGRQTASPELTTNGMLKKCWRKLNGELFLYKGGTFGAANTGLEPFSEYYAYQIADRMALNAVEYKLQRFKGQLVSVCKSFTDIDTSYVPIGMIAEDYEVKTIMKCYGESNFRDMIVFDAVICNIDRHTGNYGLLRDNKSGQYIGAAPIFDNGLSLFNYAMRDDFKDIETYAKSRLNSFNADQVTMAKAILTNEQRARLRKLIGFSFKRHESYNLPEWRLKAIEGFIQTRIKELLS